MNDYMDLGHAELVPELDLNKPSQETLHAVREEDNQAQSCASAKSSTGVSLNDPDQPSTLPLLMFSYKHRVALTTDISKMYRAIELVPAQRPTQICVAQQSQAPTT